MLYDWVRAFHIIFAIAWMAGLLMLPRLMVYRLEAAPGGETDLTMLKAISRLKAIILTPSMIIVWVLGLTMAFMQGQIILTFGWFHLKLLMVVGISAMHGVFVGMNKKIGTEKAPKPKTLRMINEVPFVLMIVAVIAVVVQPF
jgi:putative membrane protein